MVPEFNQNLLTNTKYPSIQPSRVAPDGWLETKARQPRFDFLDPVALDLDGSTGANPNGVVPGILWDGDLEGRSEFVEEQILVSRDFFDPCRYPGTVLSVFEYIQIK